MKIEIEEVYSRIYCRYWTEALIELVRGATSFRRKNYQFTQAFKDGTWDGRTHLSRRKTVNHSLKCIQVPTGFIPLIFSKMQKDFKVSIADLRRRPTPSYRSATVIDDRVLRPYQERIVDSISKRQERGIFTISYEERDRLNSGVLGDAPYRLDGIGIWHAATGSGKTLCAIALAGELAVKTLFVVYGNNLVMQSKQRFEDRLKTWISENDIEVGVIVANKYQEGFLTFASISTLSSRLNGPLGVIKRAQKAKKELDDFIGELSLPYQKSAKGRITKTELRSMSKGLMREFQAKTIKCDELLEQGTHWADALEEALALHEESGSRLKIPANTKKNIKLMREVAKKYLDALERKEKLEQFLSTVDLYIYDEVHGAGASSYFEVNMRIPAYYRIGLSGTPLVRSDNTNMLVVSCFGDVIEKVLNKEMQELEVVPKTTIRIVEIFGNLEAEEWADVYDDGIVFHEERNKKIELLIRDSFAKHEKVLAIFDWHDHGEALSQLIADLDHVRIDSRDSLKFREEVIHKLREGEIRILLASDILGTGVDIPSGIPRIINAGAMKAFIRVLQRLGRGLRGTGEFELVDFSDGHHRLLADHSLKRIQAYQAEDCFEFVVGMP